MRINMASTSNRRKFRNFLVDPNFQLRYVLYFIFTGVAAAGILNAFFVMRLNDLMKSVGADADGSVERVGAIYDLAVVTVLTYFGCVIFAVFFGIWLSHRVAGPALKIERKIREIAAGDYSKSELRPSDNLQGIMFEVNALAQTLETTRLKNRE